MSMTRLKSAVERSWPRYSSLRWTPKSSQYVQRRLHIGVTYSVASIGSNQGESVKRARREFFKKLVRSLRIGAQDNGSPPQEPSSVRAALRRFHVPVDGGSDRCVGGWG